MKTLFWILVTVVLGLGLYTYWNPDFPGQAGRSVRETLGIAPQTTVVYKWQDAAGQWQITDRPPATGIAYETLHYRSDQNLLPLPPQLRER